MYCAVSHQSAEMKVWRCETRKHVAVNYLAGLDLQYRSMKDAELAFPWVEFKPTSGRWTEFEMSSSEWLWRKLSIKELIRQKKNHIYSKVLPLPRAYLITRILTPSKRSRECLIRSFIETVRLLDLQLNLFNEHHATLKWLHVAFWNKLISLLHYPNFRWPRIR